VSDSVEAVARCSTDLRGLLGIGNAAPDLESIELEVTICTEEPEDRVQELTKIWPSRCPIYLALTKPTSVRTSFSRRM
jgi:hypothetical protein